MRVQEREVGGRLGMLLIGGPHLSVREGKNEGREGCVGGLPPTWLVRSLGLAQLGRVNRFKKLFSFLILLFQPHILIEKQTWPN
jgi:hypothetical protein